MYKMVKEIRAEIVGKRFNPLDLIMYISSYGFWVATPTEIWNDKSSREMKFKKFVGEGVLSLEIGYEPLPLSQSKHLLFCDIMVRGVIAILDSNIREIIKED